MAGVDQYDALLLKAEGLQSDRHDVAFDEAWTDLEKGFFDEFGRARDVAQREKRLAPHRWQQIADRRRAINAEKRGEALPPPPPPPIHDTERTVSGDEITLPETVVEPEPEPEPEPPKKKKKKKTTAQKSAAKKKKKTEGHDKAAKAGLKEIEPEQEYPPEYDEGDDPHMMQVAASSQNEPEPKLDPEREMPTKPLTDEIPEATGTKEDILGAVLGLGGGVQDTPKGGENIPKPAEKMPKNVRQVADDGTVIGSKISSKKARTLIDKEGAKWDGDVLRLNRDPTDAEMQSAPSRWDDETGKTAPITEVDDLVPFDEESIGEEGDESATADDESMADIVERTGGPYMGEEGDSTIEEMMEMPDILEKPEEAEKTGFPSLNARNAADFYYGIKEEAEQGNLLAASHLYSQFDDDIAQALGLNFDEEMEELAHLKAQATLPIHEAPPVDLEENPDGLTCNQCDGSGCNMCDPAEDDSEIDYEAANYDQEERKIASTPSQDFHSPKMPDEPAQTLSPMGLIQALDWSRKMNKGPQGKKKPPDINVFWDDDGNPVGLQALDPQQTMMMTVGATNPDHHRFSQIPADKLVDFYKKILAKKGVSGGSSHTGFGGRSWDTLDDVPGISEMDDAGRNAYEAEVASAHPKHKFYPHPDHIWSDEEKTVPNLVRGRTKANNPSRKEQPFELTSRLADSYGELPEGNYGRGSLAEPQNPLSEEQKKTRAESEHWRSNNAQGAQDARNKPHTSIRFGPDMGSEATMGDIARAGPMPGIPKDQSREEYTEWKGSPKDFKGLLKPKNKGVSRIGGSMYSPEMLQHLTRMPVDEISMKYPGESLGGMREVEGEDPSYSVHANIEGDDVPHHSGLPLSATGELEGLPVRFFGAPRDYEGGRDDQHTVLRSQAQPTDDYSLLPSSLQKPNTEDKGMGSGNNMSLLPMGWGDSQ